MALTWDDKEKELANANMMIAGTPTGPGASPGQRWDGLDRNPRPGDALFGVGKDGQTFFEFYKRVMGLDKGDKIADQSQFDSFMDRFKAGSSNPKFPSLNHHSPEAQKLILNTALRIRGV
tara:strand:- start:6 stop:365 length:360 start_codon:yes stop_codon:yes gene_type:complete